MRTRKHRNRNRNRSWDEPARVWAVSTRLTVFVLLLGMGFIVYGILGHHCRAIQREIASLELEQRRLTDELGRSRSQWVAMRTPRQLEEALLRHGLVMEHPTPRQMVAMAPGGPGLPRRSDTTVAAYAAR